MVSSALTYSIYIAAQVGSFIIIMIIFNQIKETGLFTLIAMLIRTWVRSDMMHWYDSTDPKWLVWNCDIEKYLWKRKKARPAMAQQCKKSSELLELIYFFYTTFSQKSLVSSILLLLPYFLQLSWWAKFVSLATKNPTIFLVILAIPTIIPLYFWWVLGECSSSL